MTKKIEAHEKPVAYIAGAINDMSSDYILNVRRMILWGDMVRELGFAVFVPGIDFLCGVVTGKWDYGVAFRNSQAFLARSDIMFVCPKWEDSIGTAKEIRTATELCTPIYYEQFGLDLLKRRLASDIAFDGKRATYDERRTLANDIAMDQDKPTRDVALHNIKSESDSAPVEIKVEKCCGTCRLCSSVVGSLGTHCLWMDPNCVAGWPVSESDGKDCTRWENRYIVK